jgi:hypothetical protein
VTARASGTPVPATTTSPLKTPIAEEATAPEEAAVRHANATSIAPIAPTIAPLGSVTSPDAMLDVAKPVRVSMAVVSEQAAIRRTLQLYEDAYEHLDARAAAVVWPSLDVPALTRAFDGLKLQHLQFDRCDLNVGSSRATAICSGSTRIVRRVGNADPLIAAQQWTFRLKRTDADWKIESVATKR